MPELSSQLLLAHTGHWSVWVLYSVPVIAVIIAIVVSSFRARRLDSAPPAADDEPVDEEETQG
jgi:cytochrome c-type biogenesis protein CcmH/NrfF